MPHLGTDERLHGTLYALRCLCFHCYTDCSAVWTPVWFRHPRTCRLLPGSRYVLLPSERTNGPLGVSCTVFLKAPGWVDSGIMSQHEQRGRQFNAICCELWSGHCVIFVSNCMLVTSILTIRFNSACAIATIVAVCRAVQVPLILFVG